MSIRMRRETLRRVETPVERVDRISTTSTPGSGTLQGRYCRSAMRCQ